MKNMKKISVVIPIYNVELYLPRCIDSIIKSTYEHLEIICVNDGSTDRCLEILNEYKHLDPRIVVINKPNGGVSSARNAGLAAATGDYVALIDSDDWVSKYYFEVLLYFAEKYKSDISICRFIRTDTSTEDLPIDLATINSYVTSGLKMLDDDPVTHGYVWARLYKRSVIERQCFSGVKVLDDAAFNFDVLASFESITCCVCDAKLYYYFRAPNSMMSGFGSESIRQVTEYYYSQLNKSSSSWQKYVYSIEILKNSIHYRYFVMFRKDHTALRERNHLMMKDALAEIMSSSLSNNKIKLMYGLLVRIPFIYRAFRILTDPTMLDWEKNEKRKAVQ